MDSLPSTIDELHGIVRRCESAIFAGTSSHHDLVALIAAEQEILRRERAGARAATGHSRSRPTITGS